MKKKILYYSDCYFFAGCENMLANFLNSDELSKEFEVHFVYRYSKRYEEGARARIKSMVNCEGVNLFVGSCKEEWVTSKNMIVASFQRFCWGVFFIIAKYWGLYRNTKTLKRVFLQFNPDIVHINNGGYPAALTAQAAVIAAHKCGVNDIYYVVNNLAMNYRHPSRWLDVFVDPVITQYVTKFITGSDNAGQHLKKILKLPDDKLKTIRNGIVQRNTTMSVGQFKQSIAIPKNRLVFSTIANLEERKGHRYLLEAIRQLRDEGKVEDVIFILEGKGPNEAFITEYVKDNQLDHYVRLISVPAIYDLYAASDVVILPSIANEDFPNIIIESMGMGIPVIGTRIAGIPEQIIPDVTGILVNPGDVGQLKEAISRMYEDAIFRKECGHNAKCIFKKNYTAEHSVSAYINLYRKS